MTVDVGDEYDRTPVFEGAIEYMIFRPYWDVPLNIQKDEIVSNIEDDPNYLSEYHFEVIGTDGRLVTDGKVSKEFCSRFVPARFMSARRQVQTIPWGC